LVGWQFQNYLSVRAFEIGGVTQEYFGGDGQFGMRALLFLLMRKLSSSYAEYNQNLPKNILR